MSSSHSPNRDTLSMNVTGRTQVLQPPPPSWISDRDPCLSSLPTDFASCHSRASAGSRHSARYAHPLYQRPMPLPFIRHDSTFNSPLNVPSTSSTSSSPTFSYCTSVFFDMPNPNRLAPSSSRLSSSPATSASRSPHATGAHDPTHNLDALRVPVQGTALVRRQSDEVGDSVDAQSRLFFLLLDLFYQQLGVVENTFASLAPPTSPDRLSIAQPPLGLPLAISRVLDAGPLHADYNGRMNGDDAPPSYALSINETTWGFLTDLIELRISMAVHSSNADGVDASTTILDEHTLRALFMHAIIWYIDRECISLTGVQVAFIGRRVGEEVNSQYPCLPITDIRDIAGQLPLDDISAIDQADFDPYMFCAGDFFPSTCGYRYLLFLVALCLLISATFGFLIACFFGTVLPAVAFILDDARVKLVCKFIFKLLHVLNALEDRLLHIGSVIFDLLEAAIHYAN